MRSAECGVRVRMKMRERRAQTSESLVHDLLVGPRCLPGKYLEEGAVGIAHHTIRVVVGALKDQPGAGCQRNAGDIDLGKGVGEGEG